MHSIVVINKTGDIEINVNITNENIDEDYFCLSLTSLIELSESLRYYLKKNEIITPKKSLSEINYRNFSTAFILLPKKYSSNIEIAKITRAEPIIIN